MALADDLATSIAGWSAALAADAADPQPSHTLSSPNGTSRSVSRDEWRAGLMAQIRQAQEMLNILNPFFIKTRQFL